MERIDTNAKGREDTMRTTVKRNLSIGALVITVALSGCADTRGPASTRDTPSAPNGVGRYKVGKPYQINGAWYHPAEDFEYEEVGMASWYGRQFHGKSTANGELYDMNDMTAAHRTLPLPSVVRVTNLDNGRTVKLRVNDRGPFARGRIIDVSRRAAQMLGFKEKGVTRVKVEIVADESMLLAGRGSSGGRLSEPVSEVGLAPDPAVAALNRAQLAAANDGPPSRAVNVASIYAPVSTRSAVVGPDPAVSALNRKQLAAVQATPPTGDVGMTSISPPAPMRSAVQASDPAISALNRRQLAAVQATPPTRAVGMTPISPPASARNAVVTSNPALSALNRRQLAAVQATPPNRAVGASPIPAPATARNAVVVPVATPSGTHTYIQAGAFSDRVNAHRVRSRLSGLGPVEVHASQVGGRDYYRVRLGPLKSDDQAGQLLADVIRAGYPSSRIVSE